MVYEVMFEHQENEIYEVWLHKVENKGFEDFRNSLKGHEEVSDTDLASIINESFKITNTMEVNT